MRRLAFLVTAIIVALAASGGAVAGGDAHELGPYTVVSPDSGTCLNSDWATDTFTRRFIVRANGDGTYMMRVQNTDGTFVTNSGKSPGACEGGQDHGVTIRADVTGKMHGTLEGTVSGGTFKPDATCAGMCFMSVFTQAFFGSAATFSCVGGPGICTFKFDYSSGEKGLLYRHWSNSDKGQGNTGDIADH